MRKLLLILIVLLSFVSAKSQNPFAEYGYRPKIATLSQGQFNEFFNNDTIVQIGSVLYNTKSKQIVAFIDTDTLFSEATLEPDIVSRWISPDPLADHPTQIGLSPYHYAGNNPIYWTDPDGRCPWCLVWAAVEIGIAVYDAYETGATIIDPNASTGQKLAAAGGFALSAIMPGGGYSKGAKETVKAFDKVMDAGKAVDKTNDAQKVIGPAGDAGGKVMKQLPENMQKNMKTSDNGGTIFKDPKNPSGNNVRVEPGKANSPNPAQQNPYVKHVKDGKVVDVNGKPIPGNMPGKKVESHIPKDDFRYISK